MSIKPPGDHRRIFIKKFTFVFVSVLGFRKNLFASNRIKVTDNLWNELVDYARWCPTVHNMQLQKVKVLSANEALLCYDSTRLLPIEDPDGKFCTVALGIFIEHLSIAAAVYQLKIGFELTGKVTTTDKDVIPFARLKLIPADKTETLSRTLIKKRKTSRLHYDGEAVNPHLTDYIKNEAAAFGHDFFCTNDKIVVDAIIDLNQQTLFEDLESDVGRGELNGVFRYDKDEAATKKDGLWSECMNFPGWLMKSVFQQYQKWDHGFKNKLIKNFYISSFKGTATLGWFAGRFDTSLELVTAGRMLARNWLFLTSQNVYIQPFGSLITNVHAYAEMNKKLKLPVGNKKLWMIFRLGYSKEPARSYRLDLKDILL